MGASQSPPSPPSRPPPTVSEYDADGAVAAADDVTTDGKFGRPRRRGRRRHLLRILLVLAQCCDALDGRASDLSDQNNSLALGHAMRSGNSRCKIAKPDTANHWRARRCSVPLISAGRRRMHFGIMGSPPPSCAVRPLHSHGNGGGAGERERCGRG